MSRLKFRAWHPNFQIMKEFEFLNIKDGFIYFEETKQFIYYKELKIMQYLGEDCKDINNVELCEDDVIVRDDEYDELYQIKFISGIFVTFNPTRRWWRESIDWDRYEIIGNIHQNPELWK